MRVFTLQRFINMARLLRQTCQHEQQPANEITEPLAFTVKQTRGSRESYSFGHVFCTHALGPSSHQWEKQNKAIFEEKKGVEEQVPTRDCKIADQTTSPCHCPP